MSISGQWGTPWNRTDGEPCPPRYTEKLTVKFFIADSNAISSEYLRYVFSMWFTDVPAIFERSITLTPAFTLIVMPRCLNEHPSLYAVHIRPKESYILSKPRLDRLETVEELLTRLINKVDSHLIRKPKVLRNIPLLTRTRNYIESNTKDGNKDIHHSHGVWSIHPQTMTNFQNVLVTFDHKFLNLYLSVDTHKTSPRRG